MIALQCDRCGKLFAYNKEVREPYKVELSWSIMDDEYGETKELLDLCPDCMGTLEKWLRKEAEE